MIFAVKSQLIHSLTYRETHRFRAPQPPLPITDGVYDSSEPFDMCPQRTVNGSEDSRMFGPVPLRDIAGRAAAVVWPVMRKSNLKYDCAAETAGELSGNNELNWRVLNRPAGFSAVPAQTAP